MNNEINGWNGKPVAVGSRVKVHAPGFGRGLIANLLAIGEARIGATPAATIEIIRTTPKSCWRVGNRASVGIWWLEVVA